MTTVGRRAERNDIALTMCVASYTAGPLTRVGAAIAVLRRARKASCLFGLKPYDLPPLYEISEDGNDDDGILYGFCSLPPSSFLLSPSSLSLPFLAA